MKLTIIRLQHFSAQDRLDMAKIWPKRNVQAIENTLDDCNLVYAAKFNDRLLAAVSVKITGTSAELADFTTTQHGSWNLRR